MVELKQYEIYWVELNPTKGSEMKKTRPCLVLSPDEMNKYLNTMIIAPITSRIRKYPFRVEIKFDKNGMIALDQIRTIDKSRIIKKFGELKNKEIKKVKDILQKMLIE